MLGRLRVLGLFLALSLNPTRSLGCEMVLNDPPSRIMKHSKQPPPHIMANPKAQTSNPKPRILNHFGALRSR